MSIRTAAALALGLAAAPAAFAQSESGVQWRPVGKNVQIAQRTLPDQAPPASSIPQPTGTSVTPCPTACPQGCGPDERAWASFEWLYWTTSGQSMPVLATTSPPGTPRGLAGVNGLPTTIPLFGGQNTNDDFRSGFRLNAGVWLNDQRTWGLEGDFFFLGQSRDGFTGSTLSNPILTRPFFNALTGVPDVEIVSFPGAAAGGMSIDSTTSAIGGGVNLLRNLRCNPCGRLDLILGYRYFNVTDEVTISEGLVLDPTASLRATPALGFAITDSFRTTNNFNGGVIGIAAERRRGILYGNIRASVALGGNTQTTEIDGSTVVVDRAGQVQSFPGGLYAQPSNIGRHSRTVFAVMPEIGIRGGVQLTPHVRAYAGYNFMYLSNAARAGDQIDTRVNPNQLPPRTLTGGPALPAFTGQSTDFWMQGVSVGLEVRY